MELLTRQLQSREWDVDVNRFLKEQIFRSWWLTLWLVILAAITVLYTSGRLSTAPITTTIVLVIWLVSIGAVAVNEVRHKHSKYTLWLKDNLYSSVTNTFVSLLLLLLLISVLFGLLDYAVLNASWSGVPPTQLRAELVATEGSEYCFTMGGILPEESLTAITVEREQRCFPTSQLVEAPAEGVIVGEEASEFCFDTIPADDQNGDFCFESSASNPAYFEVQRQFSGANWGAVRANLLTLMIFRFQRSEMWRLWATVIIIVAMFVPSLFLYREKYKGTIARRLLTGLWVISPLVFYILLRGVPDDLVFEPVGLLYIVLAAAAYAANRYAGPWLAQRQREISLRQGTNAAGLLSDLLITLLRFALAASVFVFGILGALALFNMLYIGLGGISISGEKLLPFLDPDRNWGGLLLTVIIAVFAIVVSFPIGLILALGRRSKIGGIPAWLTYTVAIAIAVWGLLNSTPGNLEAARSSFEEILAYWPLAVPIVAYLFQRTWNGNVLAAFSTLYIEFIRGIPLIAVLFISITLFPLILPTGVEILSVWRVMWGFTLFAAAYLAENVRGGLQSIPNGQYEAADALGLNTVQKYRLIILPQALRVVIPAIVGQFIGLFKDTTLVAFLGLLDFLGIANALSANPAWLTIRREVYLFLAIIYFIISALMAGYSRRLERRLGLGTR